MAEKQEPKSEEFALTITHKDPATGDWTRVFFRRALAESVEGVLYGALQEISNTSRK